MSILNGKSQRVQLKYPNETLSCRVNIVRMRLRHKIGLCVVLLTAVRGLHAAPANGNSSAMGWHVQLRSGFDLTCARMEPQGDKTRLFLHANSDDFVDVKAADVISTEQVELPQPAAPVAAGISALTAPAAANVRSNHIIDVAPLTASAATGVNVDADLIASIIHAESSGNVHAISRTGARGLMQLMPGTAGQVGVADAFNPGQNVAGGAAYFDALLLLYHDNLPLALAAYNAGPGAVAKYHNRIPPYRETQAYVRRVINEFNRRKKLAMQGAPTAEAALQLATLAAR
jgi:hypothetical protein